MNAPSPSVPVRPLIMTTDPLSRTSALPDSGACRNPGASILNSVGMFCRSIGGAGVAALMSNFSGCSPARALPVTRILRLGSMLISALMASILLSMRSRRLENTIVPPVTLTCSTVKVSPAPAAGLEAAGASFTRSRCSGKFTTGRTRVSSVTCGLPDHTLASVTSAWRLFTVMRLLTSPSFGSCSVTSLSTMLSDGQNPILVPPLMVSS